MTKSVTEHVEPKKVIQALTDPSWIEAMHDELLQFKLQKVWTLVDLPYGKRAIGTKWVYRNKKDDRGIVVRNKARLVAEGYTQEEGFEDPEFPNKVYKVKKALYGLHQAPRAWYETLSTYLLENGFRRGTIDKTLFIKKDKGDILLVQVKQKDDGIFISQDKYVADILKKFDFATVMYLTTSRPDIMFVVCACARDSPFDLEAFSDSDYAGASLDRKSTTGGCQFLGRRLISWQCKNQTIVANSTTEVEYVAAANYYETVIKEWEDRMQRAATTASSLKQSRTVGTGLDSGPRCHDTILGGVKAQIRFEAASKQSNDPPLSRVATLRSGEDNMKLKELMELCTKLPKRDLKSITKIERVTL
ncbi:putative ribonuclease H-like domain-containing protein [Tanacetum coccineum]